MNYIEAIARLRIGGHNPKTEWEGGRPARIVTECLGVWSRYCRILEDGTVTTDTANMIERWDGLSEDERERIEDENARLDEEWCERIENESDS